MNETVSRSEHERILDSLRREQSENRRLWDIVRSRGRNFSRIVMPEWASGPEWAGWKWMSRDQAMLYWVKSGMLMIDEEGSIYFDNFDNYHPSQMEVFELGDIQLCKKIADLIIAAQPPEPDLGDDSED